MTVAETDWNKFKPVAAPAPAAPSTDWSQFTPAPQSKGLGGDLGTALKVGAQKLPGAATGLADTLGGHLGFNRPAARLADAAGKATGFRPGEWAKESQKQYSPAARIEQREIDQVWADPETGAADVAGAYLRNPRATAINVVQSAPSIVAASLAGRGAGAVGGFQSAAARGAIGEGAVMAGQSMADIDESVDPRRAAQAATATGVLGAGLGFAGGRVAQRLGIADIDQVVAGGVRGPAGAALGLAKRVPAGAVQEGLLEEAPQSAVETAAQNWAEGKPLTEGMARNVTEGALAGSVMGGAAGAIPTGVRAAPAQPAAEAPDVGQSQLPALDLPADLAADAPAPAAPRRASQDMGLDAAAGPISAAAVQAVDGGATQEVQALAAAQQAAEEASKAKGKAPAPAPSPESTAPAASAEPAGPRGAFADAQTARDYIRAQRRAGGASFIALPVRYDDGSYGVATRGTPDFDLALTQSAAPAPKQQELPITNTADAVKKIREQKAAAKTSPKPVTNEGNARGPQADQAQQAAPQRTQTPAPAAELSAPAAPVDQAAQEAATSPANDRPEPSQAQKEAGNYKVGRARIAGLDISIENPQGSVRRGTSPDGTAWESPMNDHYGYIRGTTAADGDKLDVFVKPGTPDDFDGTVFVVDQVDPATGKFDEAKVVMGAADQAEAEAIYRRNYSAGWQGLGAITALPMPAFKTWAASKQTRKPLGTLPPAADVPNESQSAAAPAPQAAADQAPAPARGDGAAPSGVPAAGSPAVEAAGVADPRPAPARAPAAPAVAGSRRVARAPAAEPAAAPAPAPLDERFPPVSQFTNVSVGPGGRIEPRPIAPGRVLYRETSLGGLDDLLRMDRQADFANLFVTDNPDLAIGQGENAGVSVAFRPGSLSGREHRKPGTGEASGREYQTDLVAPRAVQTVTMAAADVKRLRVLTRRALSEFDREELDGGLVRFHRKGLDRLDLQQRAVAASAPVSGSRRVAKPKANASPAASAPPAAPAQAPAPKPAEKIEDFGEKLQGARKDYAALLKDAMEVDVAAEPLSKSWPEPDYDKLLEGGADPFVVAFVRAARDEVPTKPQVAWKLKGWVETVKVLRATSQSLLDGAITRDSLDTALAGRGGSTTAAQVASRAELYREVGHGRSLKGVSFAHRHFTLYKGQSDVQKWIVEQRAKSTAFGNWPREVAVGDTKAEMLAQFKERLASVDVSAKAKPSFVIYGKRGQTGAFIGKKIGREYVDLHKADDVKAARAYLAENTEALEKALERYKHTPAERNRENAPRVGGDHRNGAPVTPQLFAEAFGFRGVQFGNYVEQDRRQSDLNQAFDALMDLAAVLGVPPRALSLNGRLGLAFGARGRGGKGAPAAHYEPGQVVINLTKGGGPGSLAHEWWHALDNYFAREGSEPGFMTAVARGAALRPEVREAFMGIKRILNTSAMRLRSVELDKRRTKPYWATPEELSARAFESYAIAKLQDQGASNDYLANVVSPQFWEAQEALREVFEGSKSGPTFPYPLADEMPALRTAYDHFFQTVETRQTDSGVAMFSLPAGPVDREDGGPDTEAHGPASQAHRDASDTVSAALNRRLAEGGGAPTVFHAVAPGDGARGRTAASVAAVARRLFARELVYVRFDGPALFNGVASSQTPGKLLINIDSETPFMAVLGHELLHDMSNKQPEVYAALSRRLDRLLKNESVFSGALVDTYRARGVSLKGLNTREELEANIVGDYFMDPEFWKLVAEGQPNLFQRIGAAIIRWLDSVVAQLGVLRPYGTDEFLTDIAQARAAVASAIRDYSASQAGRVEDVSEPGTSLSIASAAREQIRQFDVRTKPANTLKHYRGLGMQFLGRRQIVDLYQQEVPQLAAYNRLVQHMDAEKNDRGAEADRLASAWAELDQRGPLGVGPSKFPGEERRLAELMHDATLARIDPAKGHVEGDDKAAWEGLRARYQALQPKSREIYITARDMYAGHYEEVRQAIKDRIERSSISGGQKKIMMARMDDEFFKKTQGVYFPLARFGKYVIVVRNADGEVLNVSRAETLAEAETTRTELQRTYPTARGFNVGKVLKDAEFNPGRDAVGKGFMADLFEVLDKQGVDDALRDSVAQLYLASLPDLSWAKHGIHRKGTPGFSQDARRAFAQNMFHGARYLAKLRYADQLQTQLQYMQEHVDAYARIEEYDSVKAQQVVDEMVKRHESLMNPKANSISTALTSVGFVFYLGVSPAAAMVNLSQTALVAYPVMGAKWGYNKAGAALLKASGEVVRAKNDMSKVLQGDELRAYNEAVRDGTIDVTMAHDLAGISQGEDQKVTWALRPVMRWASFLFHHAERFNRQATFVAGYRLARAAGADHKDAFEQAKQATYDGHFDYGASNRPRLMQGNVAKVVLLFKQYSQNMIYTMARQAHLSLKGATPAERAQARKMLGGILVAHALAAGTLGLPIVGPLLAAASFLGGDDDDPWDAEVALKNSMAEVFGPKAAEVIAHGLSRLTPWDISSRVALDKLLLPDVQEGLEGQRWAESYSTALLGPVVGIFTGFIKGLQDVSEGKYQRGLESMLPVALRNPVKAVRFAEEGAVDRSGVVIKDDVSLAGLLGQLVGFSPSEVRLATEGRSAIFGRDRALLERRQVLMNQFAEARMAGDDEGVAEAREAIARFNEKNPGRRITPPQLMRSVRTRQQRIDRAEQGVYLPRNRRDALEAGRFAVTQL